MKRRAFITLIGGAVAVWSSRAHGQQPAMPTIGFLELGSELSARQDQDVIEGFRSGLADLGYTEGRNIRVLYRFADGNADRLSALVLELVSLGATIILTASTTAITAAHSAAPTVPIVSRSAFDPVWMGWAQTLARPGGMITGVFQVGSTGKWFQLLKEVLPQATTFGYLMNATNSGNPVWRRGADYVARTLGINIEIIEVKDQSELPEAIHRMRSLGVAGLVIFNDIVLDSNAATIAKLALIHKLPSVGAGRWFVDAGGLFAYDEGYVAMARRSAWYVDQILKGAAPGDLPAELSAEFRLYVNLKTAKELGITIPPSVFARADEVIE
jgi:putative tryptophan/tyrosine transport system substrate-binding protein